MKDDENKWYRPTPLVDNYTINLNDESWVRGI